MENMFVMCQCVGFLHPINTRVSFGCIPIEELYGIGTDEKRNWDEKIDSTVGALSFRNEHFETNMIEFENTMRLANQM